MQSQRGSSLHMAQQASGLKRHCSTPQCSGAHLAIYLAMYMMLLMALLMRSCSSCKLYHMLVKGHCIRPEARTPAGSAPQESLLHPQKGKVDLHRCGLLMAARALKTGAATGLVVTASHNPVADNGVKLVEPTGYMLDQSWEVNALPQKVLQISDAEALPAGESAFDMRTVSGVSSLADDAGNSGCVRGLNISGRSMPGGDFLLGQVSTTLQHKYI